MSKFKQDTKKDMPASLTPRSIPTSLLVQIAKDAGIQARKDALDNHLSVSSIVDGKLRSEMRHEVSASGGATRYGNPMPNSGVLRSNVPPVRGIQAEFTQVPEMPKRRRRQ